MYPTAGSPQALMALARVLVLGDKSTVALAAGSGAATGATPSNIVAEASSSSTCLAASAGPRYLSRHWSATYSITCVCTAKRQHQNAARQILRSLPGPHIDSHTTSSHLEGVVQVVVSVGCRDANASADQQHRGGREANNHLSKHMAQITSQSANLVSFIHHATSQCCAVSFNTHHAHVVLEAHAAEHGQLARMVDHDGHHRRVPVS